jgi:hypothetical protein
MDITYVTERIIGMIFKLSRQSFLFYIKNFSLFLVLTFPESGTSGTYRANLKEVVQMLRTKHKSKYMVFNLSEKRYDLIKLNPNICEFGWPPKLAPPLERLCSICKAIDSWLTCDNHHVAVIHSKGDNGRTGVVISAFMHYTNICATADQALDRFAMKRFYDDKLAQFMQPSQKRYFLHNLTFIQNLLRLNSLILKIRSILLWSSFWWNQNEQQSIISSSHYCSRNSKLRSKGWLSSICEDISRDATNSHDWHLFSI